MKALNKILCLLFIATMFAACGSDDDKVYEEGITDNTHTYSAILQGIENQKQTVKTSLYLKDALGEEIAKNVFKSDFRRSQSYLKVKGLKDISSTEKLQNVVFKVGKREFSMGTCSTNPSSSEFPSDEILDFGEHLNIIAAIFEELKANKKADIEISFTPTSNITKETNPVYFEITLAAKYWYYIKN